MKGRSTRGAVPGHGRKGELGHLPTDPLLFDMRVGHVQVRADMELVKDKLAVLSRLDGRMDDLQQALGDYTDLNDRRAPRPHPAPPCRPPRPPALSTSFFFVNNARLSPCRAGH